MKNILYLLCLTFVIAACGGAAPNPFADCPQEKLLSVKEVFLCTDGCAGICDFQNLTVLKNETDSINTLHLNAAKNEVSCFRGQEDVYQPDYSSFFLAQGEKGAASTWFNCSGNTQDDGIHLSCKHFLSDDPEDFEICQDATFKTTP